MATYKVLIPQDVAEEGKNYLRERGYEIKMGSGVTADAIAADVVDCDAILARTAPFPAKVLEAGKKLKVISRHGVGYDNIDVAKATELGIWVTFAPESNRQHGCRAHDRLHPRPGPQLHPTGPGDAHGQLGNPGQTAGDRPCRQGAWASWVWEDRSLCCDRRPRYGLDMKVIGYDPFLKPEQIASSPPLPSHGRDLHCLGFRDPAYPGRLRPHRGMHRQETIRPDEEDGLLYQRFAGRRGR